MAPSSQDEAIARLTTMLRRMGAASALHSQAVARRVGLSSVDLECLDMILLAGPVTAGQIMEHTKLTSGAVTGLIDRLARKSYVERAADPHDRRKVIVRIVPAAIRPLQELFAPMAERSAALMRQYSAEELALIAGFVEKGTAIALERASELEGG
ncbi:MarR family transcriptional regulator [Bosea sp. (in: a-proteobacteria)]|uniref:MarR family winged helix-turn-helix transcriptional regulator n=1 Tax=Bosea sp. (in: a-proteobacteria) TaxID=1871050 RepID=UPI0025C459B8|nr:MarR family transcriptional regulator [Bosea sp. (in: a-proteobacteria)]MBR3194893.1 MarR family transcriptional regulator [Bosea sp. (in: a-proteobacteria)]